MGRLWAYRKWFIWDYAAGKRVFVKNNHRELVELEDDGFGTSVIDGLAPNQPRKWVTDKVAKAVASITSQQF